jgi:methionyl aminopeptidase
MQTMAERVGPAYSAEGMLMARAETRKAIAAIAARASARHAGRGRGRDGQGGHCRPGACVELASHPRALWHQHGPAHEESVDSGGILGENDIFFIDIAPRVDDCDGGASFVVGHAPRTGTLRGGRGPAVP